MFGRQPVWGNDFFKSDIKFKNVLNLMGTTCKVL